MHIVIKKLWFFVVLFALVSSSALAQDKSKEDGAAPYVVPSETRTITAAVPRNWPPHYTTDSAGNPDGFAIESMEAIAKIANVAVRYQAYSSFPKVIAEIEAKRVDILPNIGIADFRKKFALFTAPVETFVVSAFVRSGTLTESERKEDWRTILRGRKTGVVAKNVGQRILEKMPEVPIVLYESVHEALVDLLAGRVDALAYPIPVVNMITRSIGVFDKIETAGTPLREIKRGIAVRNDDPDLHRRLSYGVDVFVKSAAYEKLYIKWFGDRVPFWTTRNLIVFIGIPFAVLFSLLIVWRYFSVMSLNSRLVESQTSLARLNTELEGRVTQRTHDLAEQKNLFESVFQGVPDAMVVADAERKIIMANVAITTIFGYEPAEVFGKKTAYLYESEEEFERQERLRYNLTPEELDKPYVVTYARKNGETFPGETVGAAVRDENGTLLGFLGVIRDITEQRTLQAQLIQSSKMATLGEIATGIAHELNQPLNIIGMAAASITRRVDNEKADPDYIRDKVKRITDQIGRASGIISRMQIFGRQADGDKEPIKACIVIRDVLEMMGEQLRLSNIEVKTDLPETCVPVMGHKVQMEQVFLNLIANAKDAILDKQDGGEKSISIGVKDLGDENAVQITLEDTGGGIDEDLLPKIFDPFFTSKEVGKGTGLGLSISYGIIEEMGGRMEVENADLGARFTITIPATA